VSDGRPVQGLESDTYESTAGAMMDLLLGPHFDAHERAKMVAHTRGLPQHVLARMLRASVSYDSASAAARVHCPVLYVGSSTPYANLSRFRQLCPQLVTGQLVGCGRYFPLEVPAQLAPMIARFLYVSSSVVERHPPVAHTTLE
jgi:hypothetical protein